MSASATKPFSNERLGILKIKFLTNSNNSGTTNRKGSFFKAIILKAASEEKEPTKNR